MSLLAIFIIANIVNVLIQTVKSIATVKCGKELASVVNAVAYGLYTYIVILMSCDLPLIIKCLIIGGCNLVGVYIVKFIEEKIQKDKLWKIDLTVNSKYKGNIIDELEMEEIPYSYNEYGKHTMFSVFCATQAQSTVVSKMVKSYNGKYFVSENKSILQ